MTLCTNVKPGGVSGFTDLQVSRDGARLYGVSANTLVTMTTSNLGSSPQVVTVSGIDAVTVSADGTFVYAASGTGNSVAVFS